VISLARETGWSERYILDVLPLARLLIYRHAIARGNGAWTVAPGASVDSQAAALGL